MRPLVIVSTVIGHDGKSCVAIVDTEADALTAFETGCGEPVVGDLHPREIGLSVWLRGPWIRGVSQDAAAMLVLALRRCTGLAGVCFKIMPSHRQLLV